MIHEIDAVLRALIRTELLPELISDVEFAAPTRDWAARRNAPTVNAFLYDVREETARRERGQVAVRAVSGEVVHRSQPPRWFRLSYLLTAWTSRAEDEHRLLSALLSLLLAYEALPPDHLTEGLAALELPLPMTVATPRTDAGPTADVWSSLGGELKPSLELAVLAPFVSSPRYPAGPPVTKDFTLDVSDPARRDVAVRRFRGAR